MTSTEPHLLSLQVGKPQTLHTDDGTTWRSAIYKAPVKERLFLGKINLAGDKQANLRYHGGPDKAVCCFPAEHYPHWRAETGAGDAFSYGAFGENFTLAGMTEEQVCIGDIYSVGTARVQICQPRQPCINLARKWHYESMPERMIELGHTGYYLRVLEEGEVGEGDALILQECLHPHVTVAYVNEARYRREGGPERATELANLPELAHVWRRSFRLRASRQPASQS